MRLARHARVAVLIDACCVLVFVVIGRASHTRGEALAGIASTAWPFLCGLAAGWIAGRAWRRPLTISPAVVVIWLCTVTLGYRWGSCTARARISGYLSPCQPTADSLVVG